MSLLNSEKRIFSGFLFAGLAAVLFGSASVLGKYSLEAMHPLVIAFLAYLTATLVSLPFLRRTKSETFQKKDWTLLALITVSGAVVGPVLFFVGLEETSAADSAILLNAEIIFSVIFALIIFGEKIKKSYGYVAISLIVLGLFIVTTNFEISDSIFETNIGNFMIISATLFWALDNNLSKILSKRIDPAKIVVGKSALGGVVLLLIVLYLGIPIEIHPEQISSIVLLGGGAFGLSIFLFLQALKRIGTIKTVLIFSMSSVVGMILASLVLDEQITIFQITAVFLMSLGIYLLYRDEIK